ncbi:DUF4249 domain-containing protein [Salegentibacter sp. Hel_I_6]|uniref:DUF4249 domain-containing protein n=1 Tax=Salegentibacter sp. Hel_I_6 TaxID=1250278 RepID=UPI000559F2F5|nr:DUF4249 domain-containing protein [Salegentibacter sp. Hel_I_6]
MFLGKYKIVMFFAFCCLFQSCVEPIEFEPDEYEDILAVRTTITDSLETQKVYLSRTFSFGEDGPSPEGNATVWITDDAGNEYEFRETETGEYHSINQFRAQPGIDYQLQINTTNGASYNSEPTQLSSSTPIDNVEAQRLTVNGEDGIAIEVDNYNTGEATAFYRYEYEETYKIVSRYRSDYDLIYEDEQLKVVPNTRDERICYNTLNSTNYILANTSALSQNNLENFLVKFVETANPKLSQRYSLLVRQIAISRDAHYYYTTMERLSGNDNLFSQNQPGFVEGNIISDNPDLKVLGYFNVSSVSTKRIYFDYQDFYSIDDPRSHFSQDCNPATPSTHPDEIGSLIALVEIDYVRLLRTTPNATRKYEVVETECIDCTVWGTNVKPDFWEE